VIRTVWVHAFPVLVVTLSASLTSRASVASVDPRIPAALVEGGTPAAPTYCLDQRGRKYSQGAVRRFGGDLKRCESGKWVPVPNPAGTSPGTTAAPPTYCLDDKGGKYSQGGVLRFGTELKRCESGKWLPVPRAPSSSPGTIAVVRPVEKETRFRRRRDGSLRCVCVARAVDSLLERSVLDR
jgi:hypothetical protein